MYKTFAVVTMEQLEKIRYVWHQRIKLKMIPQLFNKEKTIYKCRDQNI